VYAPVVLFGISVDWRERFALDSERWRKLWKLGVCRLVAALNFSLWNLGRTSVTVAAGRSGVV
jgi:hypothetical protein